MRLGEVEVVEVMSQQRLDRDIKAQEMDREEQSGRAAIAVKHEDKQKDERTEFEWEQASEKHRASPMIG